MALTLRLPEWVSAPLPQISSGTWLALDGSAPHVQVGLLRDGQWLAFWQGNIEALEGLFVGTESVLKEAGATLAELDGFLFGEGPGSVLGIRLAAMALKTWQALPGMAERPILSYGSHEFAAARLRAQGTAGVFHVLSDYRRGVWNLLPFGGDLQTVTDDALKHIHEHDPKAVIYHLPQRKGWGQPPVPVETFPHDIEALPALLSALDQDGLFTPTDEPNARVLATPSWAKWSGERHRGGES